LTRKREAHTFAVTNSDLVNLDKKAHAVVKELAEGSIELIEEDLGVVSRCDHADSSIIMELWKPRPFFLSNIFIVDEMELDSSESRSKGCRSLFFFVDPYKFFHYCAIQGFRIVARILNLSPHSLQARKENSES